MVQHLVPLLSCSLGSREEPLLCCPGQMRIAESLALSVPVTSAHSLARSLLGWPFLGSGCLVCAASFSRVDFQA